MKSLYKNFSVLACIFIFSFCIIKICALAFSEIPLPAGSVLIRNNDLSSKIQQSTLSVYKTSVPVDKISSFFLREMKKSGWESDKQKDGSLMFKNDQEIIFVVMIPPRKPDSPSMFTITRSSRISKDQLYASKKDTPDKLSFMPLYPKSEQLFLMDLPSGGVSANYSTGDSIKNVIFFYKAQMLNYRWTLTAETPVEEEVIDCPQCKESPAVKDKVFLGQEPKGITSKASLTFRRGAGEICIIRIFSGKLGNVVSEVPGLSENNTTILVTYNENKKIKL